MFHIGHGDGLSAGDPRGVCLSLQDCLGQQGNDPIGPALGQRLDFDDIGLMIMADHEVCRGLTLVRRLGDDPAFGLKPGFDVLFCVASASGFGVVGHVRVWNNLAILCNMSKLVNMDMLGWRTARLLNPA